MGFVFDLTSNENEGFLSIEALGEANSSATFECNSVLCALLHYLIIMSIRNTLKFNMKIITGYHCFHKWLDMVIMRKGTLWETDFSRSSFFQVDADEICIPLQEGIYVQVSEMIGGEEEARLEPA